MQVSRQDDHITHAVIGNQESISMGISDDAALMHILSSTLYTYPELAAVREIVCNGWDAHINAGLTHLPLQITLTEDSVSVRDFGTGIAHDKIGPIYGVYGNSTKRNDQTVTGGFGLGSKAPFAVTDNFQVDSHHGGKKTIYRVSKSSMEKGGKPSINKILDVPSDETGICVTFGHRKGFGAFLQLVKQVLRMGNIKASINGEEPIPTIPLEDSPTGYALTAEKGVLINIINVRYGNVVYPIPDHEFFTEEFNHIKRALNGTNFNVIFMAPPDTVSIAPSREALIYTQDTLNTVKGLLSRFSETVQLVSHQSVSDRRGQLKNTFLAAEPIPGNTIDLHRDTFLEAEEWSQESDLYSFSLKKAMHRYRMGNCSRTVDSRDLLEARLYKMAKAGVGAAPQFLRRIIKLKRSWEGVRSRDIGKFRGKCAGTFTRYVAYPIYQEIDKQPLLSRDRVMLGDGDSLKRAGFWRPEEMAMYAFPKVLITTSKKAANEFFNRNRFHGRHLNYREFLIYTVGRNHKAIIQAKQAFINLNYEIIEHIPEPKKREVVAKDPNAVPAEAKPKVRRKGYPTLAQSFNSNSSLFLLSTAREADVNDNVTDPIAWVKLRNRSENAQYIGFYPPKLGRAINQLWGKQIAVVTQAQALKLSAKGVPSLKDYINAHVDKTLSAAKDFPRYLAFIGEHLEDTTDEILENMMTHEDLMKDLGLRFHVSPETMTLVQFFAEARGYASSVHMPLCVELAEKVKPSPQGEKVRDLLDTSSWMRCIKKDGLKRLLQESHSDPESREISHTLLKLILKG